MIEESCMKAEEKRRRKLLEEGNSYIKSEILKKLLFRKLILKKRS